LVGLSLWIAVCKTDLPDSIVQMARDLGDEESKPAAVLEIFQALQGMTKKDWLRATRSMRFVIQGRGESVWSGSDIALPMHLVVGFGSLVQIASNSHLNATVLKQIARMLGFIPSLSLPLCLSFSLLLLPPPLPSPFYESCSHMVLNVCS
jgi:hypothetical protein